MVMGCICCDGDGMKRIFLVVGSGRTVMGPGRRVIRNNVVLNSVVAPVLNFEGRLSTIFLVIEIFLRQWEKGTKF